MFGLFFRGNMADSSCKRLRSRRRRCQELKRTIRSLFFADYSWLFTISWTMISLLYGMCGRENRGSVRDDRHDGQALVARLGTCREASVPRLGNLKWLTYFIDFSLWKLWCNSSATPSCFERCRGTAHIRDNLFTAKVCLCHHMAKDNANAPRKSILCIRLVGAPIAPEFRMSA